jgi:hypothetical protein
MTNFFAATRPLVLCALAVMSLCTHQGLYAHGWPTAEAAAPSDGSCLPDPPVSDPGISGLFGKRDGSWCRQQDDHPRGHCQKFNGSRATRIPCSGTRSGRVYQPE